MPQIKEILSLNKAALLVTTSLVLTSCVTIDQQNQSADAKPDPAITNNAPSKGLSQESLMRVANRAWEQGNPGTALRLYNIAIQKNPKSTAPYLAVAEILRKTERAEAAIDVYNGILKGHPDTLEAHRGIGYSLLNLDKPYLATQSFEAAIALDPQNAKSLGGMGVALDTAGEHDKAQDYYRHAIKAEPQNLTYQNNLALSLALVGKTEQAIAMLEIITAHPKATSKHRQNLALVYGMAGKSADAMRYSRMDLNEKDARNNALYFQALNATPSSELAEQNQQNYAMAAAHLQDKQAPEAVMHARSELVARHETVELNTVADTGSDLNTTPHAAEPPRQLTPPLKLTPPMQPRSDYVQVAQTPKLADELVAEIADVKPQQERVAKATVVTFDSSDLTEPVIVARNLLPQAPVTAEPVAKTEIKAAVEAEAETAKPAIDLAMTLDMPEIEDIVQPQARKIVPAPVVAEVLIKKATFSMNTNPTSEHLYFAQIGSFRTPERAMYGWKILLERNTDILGDFKPIIAKAELGPEKGGTYYRVRIGGFDEKSAPQNLCDTLKSRAEGCYMPRVTKASLIKSPNAPSTAPQKDHHRGAEQQIADINSSADTKDDTPSKEGDKPSFNGYNIASISY